MNEINWQVFLFTQQKIQLGKGSCEFPVYYFQSVCNLFFNLYKSQSISVDKTLYPLNAKKLKKKGVIII